MGPGRCPHSRAFWFLREGVELGGLRHPRVERVVDPASGLAVTAHTPNPDNDVPPLSVLPSLVVVLKTEGRGAFARPDQCSISG
jgi:hypothetical protein